MGGLSADTMTVDARQNSSGEHTIVRRALATLGTLITAGVVVFIAGPLGVLIAVGVGSACYLISTPAGFATGQIILSALYPSEGPLLLLLLAEIGLLGVLFSTIVTHHAPGRLAVSSLVAGVAIGVFGWIVLRSGVALWIVASMVVVGIALVTYGMHRYERVTLGLVEYNE